MSERCGKCGNSKGSVVHDLAHPNAEVKKAAHPFEPDRRDETLRSVLRQLQERRVKWDATAVELRNQGEPEESECYGECACSLAPIIAELQAIVGPVSKEGNNILDSVQPPWETAPEGVVSLLAMLEFAARDYVEISYQFGIVLGTFRRSQINGQEFSKAIDKLLKEVNRLGLLVTRDALGEFLLEMVKTNPSCATMVGEGDDRVFLFKDAGLNDERLCHHIEAIYSTLKAELRTTLFKVIPKERVNHNSGEWLKGSELQAKFPTSFTELIRGGSCYSLGQPTASVFHGMRALEPGLAALAKPFGISASHENWNTIIEQIESEIRKIGQQPKSDQKIADEKFFGGAASHLYFVKNAWRNHVAHTRDSYGDDEALKILARTHDFIESLCGRLQE